MLATSENVLFAGHNHLLTTSTNDPSLASIRATIKVSGHQYQWLAGGYDLEVPASMVVTWWIVAFLHSALLLVLWSIPYTKISYLFSVITSRDLQVETL